MENYTGIIWFWHRVYHRKENSGTQTITITPKWESKYYTCAQIHNKNLSLFYVIDEPSEIYSTIFKKIDLYQYKDPGLRAKV